ncbi:MAG: site-specific DNA-methyltransferase, partial [Verrucomicrobiae bacterium]|nr:site-specific DNA-methyltransferase [Verrucomicrobiae bacterium]
KGHPAVFPVDLPLFFISFPSPPESLVVDSFAGSGTTGVTALAAARRCVLIDNNPKYCEQALRRIEEEVVGVRPVEPHRSRSTTSERQTYLLEQNSTTATLPRRKPAISARPEISHGG